MDCVIVGCDALQTCRRLQSFVDTYCLNLQFCVKLILLLKKTDVKFHFQNIFKFYTKEKTFHISLDILYRVENILNRATSYTVRTSNVEYF